MRYNFDKAFPPRPAKSSNDNALNRRDANKAVLDVVTLRRDEDAPVATFIFGAHG